MASLDNSSRSILQATYAPVAVDATKSADEGRAVEKHSFLASIQINTDEIKRVRQAVANDGIAHYEGFSASADEVQLALDACERLAAEQDARAPLLAAPFLAAVKPAALIVVGGAIASDRSAAAVHTPSTSPADGNVALQTVETAMTKPEFDPGRVTRDLVTGFARSSQVEPVGFLHLERLMFTPSGIERGELVHSIPMAPEEEINVAHKEWSTTSEEFQRIDTDYEEQFSEIGVAEKSELAQATSSQHQHSSGLNTGVTASGSYGPVTVTASLSTNAADSASASEQASRNVSASTTRKASKRSQQEHKVSFKVASAAGTQDEAVRRIRNPFTDKAVRFDYYQLVRKWKVDLYRYGIRLTFDLTIPDPGAALFARIEESQAIAATLEEGFGSPDATEPWAKFSVRPSDLRRDNYLALAAEYGASVPSPPEEFHTLEVPVFRKWNNFDETRIGDVITVEFDVPEGYALSEKIAQRYMVQQFEGDEEGPRIWDDSAEPANVGDSRKIVLQIVVKRAALYWGHAIAKFRVTDDAFHDWQMRAWTALRDAARNRYDSQRQALRDRLTRLTAEMGADDPLTLRKREREEVMKATIRWLFGPSFRFSPLPKGTPLYGASEDAVDEATYTKVLAQGELITFLHQAIEWENLLYFLYPYFWADSTTWPAKRALFHPDPMHRVFLKAGSARVVLTIRPGFEEDFLGLLDTGALKDKPSTHYQTIADQMKEYANTNYPGLPAANKPGSEGAGHGKLIGTWYEYTPTSALDISMNDVLPSA